MRSSFMLIFTHFGDLAIMGPSWVMILLPKQGYLAMQASDQIEKIAG